MPTTFSKSLQPSNSTDANFRGWAGFVDRTLTNGGWVNTADTGQTAIASLVAPTAINQARGYRVYRMDDSLQATYPVYLRLDFGSAGAVNNIGLWITLGPATDEAGAVLKPWFYAPTSGFPTIAAGSSYTTLALPYSFGSAGTDRVAVSFASEAQEFGAGPVLFFAIERTYGVDGLPNSDGVLLMYASGGGTSIDRYHYLRYTEVVQPAYEQENRRVQTEYSLSAASDLIAVSVLFPWYRGLPQQPGMNVLVGRRGDWSRDARINVEFYGAQHVYQALMSQLIFVEGNTLSFMRYE